MLTIHQPIREKLDYFHQVQKIPHIIFHGPSGSGKRTLLYEFIEKIYNGDKERIKQYTMNINCAHGKGIKFIREDLKFFAKTHIHSNGGDVFKSILLMNADKLTMDAQSALRRCIELFSHNTRFFIVVEDKYKLLKPILSRFCEIYVPEVMVDGQPVNLYRHNVEAAFGHESEGEKRLEWLEKSISKMNTSKKNMDKSDLYKQAAAYYEKGYSGLDVIQLLEDRRLVIDVSEEKRCEWLVAFHKVRKEIRNETLLIVFLLHFLFVDREKNLDNLSFM